MQLMHVENASRNNVTVNKSLFYTISKNKMNNKPQIELLQFTKKSLHLESLAVPGKKYTHYGSIL